MRCRWLAILIPIAVTGAVASAEPAATPEQPALVGHWALDDAGGTTVHDSGSGHTDGEGREMKLGQPGHSGSAATFDGQHAYVHIGNPDSLNFEGPITLSAWIKPNTFTSLQNVLAHGRSDDDGHEVFLRINDDKYEAGSVTGPNQDHMVSVAAPAGDAGKWVLLTATFDGHAWSLYRNGRLLAAAPNSVGSVLVPLDWAVGAQGTGNERFFNGMIQDARIYRRCLGVLEVARLAGDALAPAGAAAAAAPDAMAASVPAAAVAARTGQFTTQFTERSPLSSTGELARRFAWKPYALDYKLAQESFEVYVPPAYRPGDPYGLLVWIHSTADAKPPPGFDALFDKYHLIYVAADHDDDGRVMSQRFGLPLDAVHNMSRRYTLDAERIYLTGDLGGGFASGCVSLIYPDVFTGGFPVVGSYYYGGSYTLDPANPSGPAWTAPQPPANVLALAKNRNRYVLLTGERDHGKTLVQSGFLQFRQAGFTYCTYLEVPEMGHEVPPTAWFEKGLIALDRPLNDAAPTLYKSAMSMEKRGQLGEALMAYQKAALRLTDAKLAADAQSRRKKLAKIRDDATSAAQAAIDDQKFVEAEVTLTRLVKQFAGQAPDAAGLLERLRHDPKIQAARRAQTSGDAPKSRPKLEAPSSAE